MKKFIYSLFAAIIAFMAISCETPAGPNNDNRLQTPAFTLNVQGNSIVVAWEKVTGAAYYEVALDPGSIEKTDKTVHKFDELQYNTEYTIYVRAIATDEAKNSDVTKKSVKTEERIVPAYREFIPQYGASAQAISNNGRWVVGGFGRMGYILDLSTDNMVEFPTAELYDVADNGTAVGSDHSENPQGDAAILIGDTIVQIKGIKEMASVYGMSCATGITPDGEYVVGWYYDHDETSYYVQMYGYVVPFCYDVIKERITIPTVGERIYNEVAATHIKAVSPTRELLGCEQSMGMHNIVWTDEYTPFEYVHFLYDKEYNPVYSMGDTQNNFTQSGRYVYGKAVDYANGQAAHAATYDRTTETMYTFTGGAVTAMSDNGIAFLNDTPYYLGTTSYVIDINKGEPYAWMTLEQWLKEEHSIDVGIFEPTLNETADDDLYLEGIIVVGTSEDGRTIVGITNTMAGWVTFVVDLDGDCSL